MPNQDRSRVVSRKLPRMTISDRARGKDDAGAAAPYPPPLSGRDRQWASTHRRILDAARRSFEERGYHDTAMAEVAGHAGVTRTALYQHFDNKLALITQLVRELPPPFGDAATVRDRDAARRWIHGVIAWYEQNRPLMIAVRQADAFASEFDDYIVHVTDRLADRMSETAFGLGSQTTPRKRTVRLRLMLTQLDWFCTRAILQRSWDGDIEEDIEAMLDLWFGPEH